MNDKNDKMIWKGQFPLSIALVHYPVMDKAGIVTATATTNFDIHDLSRLSRTYGLEQYYIVTPVPTQIAFVQRIIDHWQTGWGATYNPTRQEAMRPIKLVQDLSQVYESIERERKKHPILILTSAKNYPNSITYERMAELIAWQMNKDRKTGDQEEPLEFCIIFGTGWGVHASVVEDVDYVLEPIPGLSDGYNHLSVRSAASIIIDRLVSRVREKIS